MHLLIPYDITDDKRRRVVDKILSHYGTRVNYSVFEVELTKAKFYKLIKALEENTDKKHDHVRIYVLGKESLKKSFILHREKKVFEHEVLYF